MFRPIGLWLILCGALTLVGEAQQGKNSKELMWTKSWDTPISPIEKGLTDLLADEAQIVTIAPIVMSVETPISEKKFAAFGMEKQAWKKMIKSETMMSAEMSLQDDFSRYKNFKVVDRYTIERVLSELKFSMALSNDERLQVGQNLGATHLLAIEVLRSLEKDMRWGEVVDDMITMRLIDIQTGQVLASQYKNRRIPSAP